MNVKISVLICTRNRPDDIKWALPSVLSNTYPDYEVILVDQSDGNATRDIVAPYLISHANLRYVPTETRGLSLARNLAISRSTGDIIAFTDDDCETTTEWVATVARLFADPTIDILFGQVHQPADLNDPTLVVPCLYFNNRQVLRKGKILGMGANMAFRRSVVDRIGLYDVMLGAGTPLPGGEDFDFSYRAQLAGAQVVVDPSLVLVHRAHRTQEQWMRVLRSYGIGDAAFYTKHARCGDWWAARQLCFKFGHAGLRTAARTLLRRRNDIQYFQGLVQGVMQSRKLRIDRQARLYRRAEQTARLTPTQATAKKP